MRCTHSLTYGCLIIGGAQRESLAAATADDFDDRGDDEAPTVVVLREGDLTAEEVEKLHPKSTASGK